MDNYWSAPDGIQWSLMQDGRWRGTQNDFDGQQTFSGVSYQDPRTIPMYTGAAYSPEVQASISRWSPLYSPNQSVMSPEYYAKLGYTAPQIDEILQRHIDDQKAQAGSLEGMFDSALPGLLGGALMAGVGWPGFSGGETYEGISGTEGWSGSSPGSWDYGQLASAGVSDVPQGVVGEVSGGEMPEYDFGGGTELLSDAPYEGVINEGMTAAPQSTMEKILSFVKENPWALSVGGSLLSSGIGALGSYFSSQAQQKAAQSAQNTLWNMYQQNRADLAPWREAGVGALGRLVDMTTPGKQFDTMQLDPGYQFRLSEGQKALDNMLRARGRYDSGGALQEGMRYNQGFASNEFGNVWNRNAGLAGIGQTATNTGINAGMNTANNAASLESQAGNARASGYMGIANALSGGIGSGVNLYNQIALLEALKGS